jgi:ABC-type transporter Mla subunit MlaD
VNRANPKLIGAFVVGAVALVVVGVLLLGGAKWLTEKRTFVAYFEGSVKGLNVGAPVEFQGVRVGSVTDMQLQFLTAEKDSDQLICHVDTRVTPMVDNLMETSTRLRATIARVQQVVDGDVVRVLQDTNRTLQEFTGAARSVRVLADYLERNPDSVLYGKSGSRRSSMGPVHGSHPAAGLAAVR